MDQSPPGPRRLLNRGFALRGLRKRPLEFIIEMAARYGDIVSFRCWRNPIFFLNHPDVVREVLVSRTEDFVSPYALPRQIPPALSPVAKPPRREDGIFVCGDYLDTASIQGAMLSGRRAAEHIIGLKRN